MRSVFASAVSCLACVALVGLSGCGSDDGLGRRYQVSGKVTHNGQPLKSGRINFVAEDDKAGHNASGEIIDGEIKNVGTLAPGDGIQPGKYKVAITAIEDVDVDGVTKKYVAAPDQVAVSQAQAKAKSLIPEKYNNAFDSGLTADITSDKQELTFDVKD